MMALMRIFHTRHKDARKTVNTMPMERGVGQTLQKGITKQESKIECSNYPITTKGTCAAFTKILQGYPAGFVYKVRSQEKNGNT
jgi:hypothetical protein